MSKSDDFFFFFTSLFDRSLHRKCTVRAMLWSLFTRNNILTLTRPLVSKDNIQWDKGNQHISFRAQLVLEVFTFLAPASSEYFFNIFEIGVFRATCILRMVDIYFIELPHWLCEQTQFLFQSLFKNSVLAKLLIMAYFHRNVSKKELHHSSTLLSAFQFLWM